MSSHVRVERLNRHIGAKLTVARQAASLSIFELAHKLGIPPERLSEYESGRREISPIDLLDVADALEREFSYFFEGFAG